MLLFGRAGRVGDGKSDKFGEVVSSEIFNDTRCLVIAFVFVGQTNGIAGRDGFGETERHGVTICVNGNTVGFDALASVFDDEVIETRNGVGKVLVEGDGELIAINHS